MNSLGTLRRVYWECLYAKSSSGCSLEATHFQSLFFMSSGLKSGRSLSPDLVVVLDAHVLECYLGHC